MDFYQISMFGASILLGLRNIPQNYKIYQNKSARDFSYIAIIFSIIGLSIIIMYGFHMGLVELWIPPIFSIGFIFHLLGMKIYYDNYYKQPEIEFPVNNDFSEEVCRATNSQVIIGIYNRAASEHLERAFTFP